MAHVERIRIYPVKALDAVEVDATRITEGGTLEGDREYALFDSEAKPINGKRTSRVHDLRTGFDPETGILTVRAAEGDETRRFDLRSERDAAAEWFGAFFGEDVTIRRDSSLGFVDRRDAGPSVVSTATVEEVASWFDDLTVESVRRRLRANIEIGGVPAFWEDRFVGAEAPPFVAGGVRLARATPCGRCVVPQRDPDTGEPLPEFRDRFVQCRKATFPEWADPEAFEHYYSLMLIAQISDGDRGKILRVDDEVEV